MKKALALALAGAFAVPAVAEAAPSEIKVTGGGKTAAGETIAFVAQGNASAAKGQVQYNDHNGTKAHGVVTCVHAGPVDTNGDAQGGEANGYEIAGTLRDGSTFNIKGTDGGQPTEGTSSDTVVFDGTSEDSECDLQPEEDYEGLPALAHGNIKIHKTSEASTRASRRTEMRAAKKTANASTFNAGAAALSLTSLSSLL
jgi:hypothetical protein